MAKLKHIQTRFTQGQLSQALKGRVDIDQYYGAAEYMRNVLPLAEGGFTRRHGLEYIDAALGSLTAYPIASTTITAPRGGTAANAYDNNNATLLTTTAAIGTTDPYIVVQLAFAAPIVLGVVYIYGLYLSAGSSSEFFLQKSDDGATWVTVGSAMSLTTSAKEFSFHIKDTTSYVRIVRIGATDLGAGVVNLQDIRPFTEAGISNTKLIEFEFNVDQTYIMILSDKNLAIYQDDVFLIDIYLSDYTSARIPKVDYLQSGDTLLVFHEDVLTKSIVRGASNYIWTVANVTYSNIPRSYFDGVVGADEIQNVDFSGFTSGDFYLLSLDGFVTAPIQWSSTPATTATNLQAALRALANTAAAGIVIVAITANKMRVDFLGGDAKKPWPLLVPLTTGVSTIRTITGGEVIWSATRGYPRHAAIYQGRLWVDGGRSRPTVMYGSNVGNFYNFSFGSGLADNAIGPISFEGYNQINNIFAGKQLTILTSGGEYIMKQSLDEPLTPASAPVTRSLVGSEPDLSARELDGGIYYVQRGGKALRNFQNDDTQQVFSNNITSFISSDLLVSPVDFTIRKTSSDDQYSYLLMPTADGNLTVATILTAEGIASFTYQTTDGLFKNCANDKGNMYFIVQRTIGGASVKYFEKFNKNHFLDSSVLYTTGLPTDTFTGLDHLNGKTCRAVADYYALANVIPANGSVTIAEGDAEDYCEIGLNYNPYVKDLPYENPQVGTTLGRKMRVARVDIHLKDTRHVQINDISVPLDVTENFNGVKSMYGLTGYGQAQIEITQDDPLPMTVLSMSKSVRI